MVNNIKNFVFIILLFIPVMSWGANCPSGNLYVDFDAGSDAAAGTSTGTAWQHCPGDANATGVANCTLIPGNTVNFKGGVYYKGKILLNASGTSGSQITFEGQPSGWGTGKAIIDGTEALTFNACTGQGTGATECDNANWANMYYATIPAATSVYAIVFENSSPVPASQLPDLSGSFRYGDIKLWRAVSGSISSTQVTDSTLLTSVVDDYYKDMYVLHHVGGGQEITKATAYNGTTHTLTYTALSGSPQTVSADSKYHYALYNHVKLISGSSQCAVDVTNLKAYIWPSSVPTNMGISSRDYGINVYNNSYVTITGFKIFGQLKAGYDWGIAVLSTNSGSQEGIIIENNDISGIVGTSGVGGVPSSAVGLYNTDGTSPNYIRNNTLSHVRGTRGIIVRGPLQYVQNNTITYVHGAAIYYPAGDVGEISGNNITDGGGIHSNGISVYGGLGSTTEPPTAKNISVFNNQANRYKVSDNWTGGGAATIEACDALTFYNNILDGRISHWGIGSVSHTYLKFYNNIITEGLLLYPSVTGGYAYTDIDIRNNIIGGAGSGYDGLWIGPSSPVTDWSSITNTTHQYNLYLSYSSQQSVTYSWVLGTGEVYNTTKSATYTDFDNYDFTHVSGTGLGVNTGTDLSVIGGFSTDILSVARGASWDIGAYEYGSGVTAPTALGVSLSGATLQ